MLHFHTLTKCLLLAAVAMSPALLSFAEDYDGSPAYDFSVDGIYYKTTSTSTVEVALPGTIYDVEYWSGDMNIPALCYDLDNYTAYSGNVVIPDKVYYNGSTYTVTAIGDYAFYESDNLTSVEIPNSVTAIGNGAFIYCGLTSVEIPNSVTVIGDFAFYCSGLTSVEIPDAITTIGEGAFYGFYFDEIFLPKSVTYVSSKAFARCRINKAAYPSSIPNPFVNGEMNSCDAIQYPANESVIEDGVVWSADKSVIYFVPISLTGEFEIPNTVTTIGDYAFFRCKLTSVEIPNSVSSIGYRAFADSGLTSVEIPNSITSIDNQEFWKCSSLTSVKIPNSVTTIGDYAFYLCPYLISVKIPDFVTTIGDYAFAGCAFTSINIPGSVTSIGNYAFRGCSHLTSIEIPNSVTTIGDWAFSDCSRLSSVEIPNSVTSIGDYVFSDCSRLTSVEIPNSVTSIGYGAFYDCISLRLIEIPNSVMTIGDGAFLGCRSLKYIEIPNSVTSIGDWAFYCSAWEITVFATTPPNAEEDTFDYLYVRTLYVPEESVDLYKSTTPWSYFENIVGIEVDNSALFGVKEADADAPIDYYNLRGTRVSADALTPGIYIKCQGGQATKVLIP